MLNRNKNNWHFFKFPLHSTLLLPPCPTAAPASLVSIYLNIRLLMSRKNINTISPDYKKDVTLFKKTRCRRDETLNPQEIPANTSACLHDNVIFQFIVYYCEPSQNKLKATYNSVNQAMDLLLSRPTNTGENQPKTKSADNREYQPTPHLPLKKLKICTRRLFFCSNLTDLHRMI